MIVRNVICLLVGIACLSAPQPDNPAHRAIAATLVLWAGYRIVTRSHSDGTALVDAGWAVALGAAIPWIEPSATFATTGVAQAVAGVTIATLSIQLTPRRSVPLAVLVIVVYAASGWRLVGVAELVRVDDLYGLLAAWGAGLLVRHTIVATAAVVDAAYRRRVSAQIALDVSTAMRNSRHEQLSTLHDTAAATLVLIVGVADPPSERLAIRAAHDLASLTTPVPGSARPTDVVALLTANLRRGQLPLQIEGRKTLLVDAAVATAVTAAATEAVNNAERHARASRIVLAVNDTHVTIVDDGIGFVPGLAPTGWGMRQSIVARMARVGGQAIIRSAPGAGTEVTLRWPGRALAAHGELTAETDRVIGHVRAVFGVVAAGYAATQVVIAAPTAVGSAEHGLLEAMLVTTVVLCAAVSVPGVNRGRRRSAEAAALVLAAVALVQPLLLTTSDVRTGAWPPSAIGLCLIPLVVRMPFPRAALILMAYWAFPTLADLWRLPFSELARAVGPTSWLAIQLGMCAFGPLSRRAARALRADYQTTMRIGSEERVRTALRAQYAQHYTDSVARLVPLLSALRDQQPITDELRHLARVELRCLRDLFERMNDGNAAALIPIRLAIRRAEARGVDVSGHLNIGAFELTGTAARRLTATVREALDDAVGFARVVISTVDDSVTASVVHGMAADGGGSARYGPEVDVFAVDTTQWVSVCVDAADPAR